MANFCEKVQELLRDENIDPFLKAAWIQWAFLRIHPFEDGNGRVSRIVSSLPLYKIHMPPIVVKTEKSLITLQLFMLLTVRAISCHFVIFC